MLYIYRLILYTVFDCSNYVSTQLQAWMALGEHSKGLVRKNRVIELAILFTFGIEVLEHLHSSRADLI